MTRIRRRFAGAPVVAALVAVFMLVLGAPAHASVNVGEIANSLRSDPVYVAKGSTLNGGDADDVRKAFEKTGKLYLVALPAGEVSKSQDARFLSAVRSKLREHGTYVILSGNHLNARSDTISDASVKQAVDDALSTGNPRDGLVKLADDVADAQGGGSGGSSSSDSSGSWVGGMVVLGVLVVIVLGVIGVGLYMRKKRREREERELAELKQTVQEDVTKLGEDITSLDTDVATAGLQQETRDDYQQALNSYDMSKRELEMAKTPQDMQSVTRALEDGRYAMSCVRALLNGLPRPERRAPCFFNPQHGPSTTDVTWAPMGGAPREVPACAADAERVLRGEDPEARLVAVGGQRRPYWEAGPGYAPYAGGYFGGFGGNMLGGLLVGTALGSMLSPGWGMGGFGGGWGDGGFDGGGDWGGGDFGGGDFGGGGWDFGGGDFGGFGGGDFGGGDF